MIQLRGDVADTGKVAVLCLQYPNGRTHRMDVPNAMKKGEEFDLFARRWRVIGEEPKRRRTLFENADEVRGVICRQVASSH